MTLWKLTLAYDGTPYHGWQVQPGLPTIQGMLAEAIHRIAGESVLPQGSGRTDAGVHALAQVASFALASPIPAANLHRALNRCLPPSIRILAAEHAAPGFHARHSALRKTYEYRIFPLRNGFAAGAPDRICPPTLAPFVWPCPWPLSLDALNQAARHVLGMHDFTTFAASDPDQTTDGQSRDSAKPPVRNIYDSCWHTRQDLFVYAVTGSGFLHHMVRNLVGTFVQAGARRLDPEAIPSLLAARNRAVSGPTAPPTGLFLIGVEYPEPLRTTNHQPLASAL
jgi:tRNA pseudouridine38-40 synthase